MFTVGWLCGKIPWLPSRGSLPSHAESGSQRNGRLGRSSNQQTPNKTKPPADARPRAAPRRRRVTRTEESAETPQTTAPPRLSPDTSPTCTDLTFPRGGSGDEARTAPGTKDPRLSQHAQLTSIPLQPRSAETCGFRIVPWCLRYGAPTQKGRNSLILMINNHVFKRNLGHV